jgi:hypothetical protein
MMSKDLVAICIAEEAIIMLSVYAWIAKLVKNISTPAVSVCTVEVQRLLDEGGSW